MDWISVDDAQPENQQQVLIAYTTYHGRRAVERAHGIKTSPNLCLSCGHDIHAHDKQYGCAEDGCDCETPNDQHNRAQVAPGRWNE